MLEGVEDGMDEWDGPSEVTLISASVFAMAGVVGVEDDGWMDGWMDML